jgi:putative DNA primase/helicase
VIDLNPTLAELPPKVRAVAGDVGLGKTRAWRERVAAKLVAMGLPGVLSVPRHRLGDEVVADLANSGIEGRVWRGREADDPDAPGEKMCREPERVELVMKARLSVQSHACFSQSGECPSFNVCGYQRQQCHSPDVWIVAHQLLFHPKPESFPWPAAVAIDESFWNSALQGLQPTVKVWLRSLRETRYVPRDLSRTADLNHISQRVHAALIGEKSGYIRSAALLEAGITADDLHHAYVLEWRRKIDPTVHPNMSINKIRARCQSVAARNEEVFRLTTLWKLLQRTAEGHFDRSPWLELRTDEPVPITTSSTEPAIRMIWREDIHDSWQAPTMVMDATLPELIVKEFFPQMERLVAPSAPTPHARVRQIIDNTMPAGMLIPSKSANDKTNQTRRNHGERIRRFIEVRANEVRPGKVLVICQLGLEKELRGQLPDNVDVQHYNNIAGENAWSNVALLIVIGRTEASPQEVERTARALFGADIAELEPGHWYPQVQRGVRMRDGTVKAVEGSCHPDPRAEAVRWQICEAGLIQSIGRGRAVNRSAANPLQIDILTKVVLPIEVDEVTTWDEIQPSLAQVMKARGAVPVNYRDMATAYKDLFRSGPAAQMALLRENPQQTPIERYLISVCGGFLSLRYRRSGSRGPASILLYDPELVCDPVVWLSERVGKVTVGRDRPPALIAFC